MGPKSQNKLSKAIIFSCWVWTVVADASSHPPSTPSPSISIRLPGRYYEDDDEDFFQSQRRRGGLTGLGREFDLFDTRGGQNADAEDMDNEKAYLTPQVNRGTPTRPASNRQQQRFGSSSSSSYPGMMPGPGGSNSRYSNNKNSAYSRPTVFQSVQEWWTCNIAPTVKNWPRIQCRVEPTTTLKIRKTFRPLKTIVRLGADFNTQLGVWQFKSSWEDAIIGGKITLAGKELQLSKSWQLSVGAVEDLVTRLRFRAAVDLQTWKAYARVGFRTERLSPINIMEGFTLLKQLPLDGNKGNVKLEVKANFALPEPEIEYSTESHRSLVGMGDIEVNIDELNLVLDY